MKNSLMMMFSLTRNIKILSLTTLTSLVFFSVINNQAKAATVTFDGNKFSNSNPNTCIPQLSEAKCFVDNGINVEAFSAQEIATTAAFFSNTAHFHASNSYEAQHFNNENALLGVYLTRVNGGLFTLSSLDYQIRNIESGVIAGFPSDDIKILISTNFDPTASISSQFREFSIGNSLAQPFQTLAISDFQNISSVYIASSAGVNFDNITIASVPEPSFLMGILALGTIGGFSLIKTHSKRES